MDRISDRAILAVGWLLFLVYAYPGYMSYDSTWQLAQARHIEPVNEWHPPVMAYMWRYLDDIVAGPFLMLVVQSTLFLLGTYSILRRVISPRKAALVAAILLIAPPNIVVMAVIWKDSQMAAFLIAGIAALLTQRRGWRIFGYVCIFMATAMRYNAAAATFPILLFQLGYGGTWATWKRLGLACVAWLAITAGSFALNGVLTETHQYPWPTAAATVDIAGIIRFAPHLDNDKLLRDTPNVPWHKTDKIQIRARTWYRPENQFLNLTTEPGQIFDWVSTPEQRAGVTAAWKKLVFAYPWAFFRHRIAVFGAQLDSAAGGAGGVYSGFTNPVWDELLQHRATHSAIQEFWIHKLEWFDNGSMYHVVIYFILTLVLLPFARRDRIAGLLLLSGLAHELGLFAVAPAIDYRYSHWMVACALLAAVILFVRRYRLRPIATKLSP